MSGCKLIALMSKCSYRNPNVVLSIFDRYLSLVLWETSAHIPSSVRRAAASQLKCQCGWELRWESGFAQDGS